MVLNTMAMQFWLNRLGFSDSIICIYIPSPKANHKNIDLTELIATSIRRTYSMKMKKKKKGT